MKKYFVILLITVAFLAPVLFAFASTTQGTIDSTYKYAWSDEIGWINFGCDNCNVQITDSKITGYAWSENYGWINLNPDNGGVLNTSQGVLSGKAWGENVGWIDFSGATINSSGQFTGSALGDVAGTIAFENCGDSCKVTTDWRPASARGGTSNTGGGGGNNFLLPGPVPPPGGFVILINNGEPATNNPAVNITLDGGKDAVQIKISSDPNFAGVSSEVYETSKTFVLPAGDGKKTVYVKFIAKNSVESSAVSASIILDTQLPALSVSQQQTSFDYDQDVVISGTSEPNSTIIFSWDDKYASTQSDSQGNWTANFGKLSPSDYVFDITAKDLAGNAAKRKIKITVEKKSEILKPEQSAETFSLLDLKKIESTIKSFFLPKQILLPKTTIIYKTEPAALGGKWNLLPIKLIK